MGVYAVESLLNFSIPTELLSMITDYARIGLQIVLDGVAMSLVAFGAGFADYLRKTDAPEERPIRKTFQGWLLVVMTIAFMLTESLLYTVTSVSLIASANETLDNHLSYVQIQLADRDGWLDRLEDEGSADTAEHQAIMHQSISSIATNLKLGSTGITIIAEDGHIVSASDYRYNGDDFERVIGAGLQDGFSEAIYESERPLQFYLGSGTNMGYLRAAEMSYVRVQQSGNYQIAAILPAAEVFAYRSFALAAVGLIFLALFGMVYLLAMGLLDQVVVKNIDATNEALDRITRGDLTETVDIRNSREFKSLSAGINSTVGALKDSIVEAQTRIDRELATSKAIQKSALPQVFPPFPEIERFDIFASMNPAREVGGDFYDFFLLDDSRLGMVMADVSGKGIPAALFMMSAKTELAACMQAGMDIAEAVQTANWRLCQGNETGMFVTAFIAVLDYETGVLSYVNAGHNPPLIRRADGWEWLREKSGTFLGAFDSVKYKPFSTTLAKGDELIMYTDGVTECMDVDGNLYGEDRLEEFLSRHTDLHPRKLIEAVGRDLDRYAEGAEQADDITMLSVEYGQAPEVSASMVFPATLEELPRATAFVHGELARRMCPISVQNKIDICLEELFVNVASYAYPDATEDKPGKVRVSYLYTPDPQGITIEISDEGVPFDPLAKPDPTAPASIEDARIGGLGIMMTKQLSDDISYVYVDDCNVTAFTKRW